MLPTNIKFTINFEHPITTYVLAMGGWFPPPFLPQGILLLDRNILQILFILNRGSKKHNNEANRWWLSLFNSEAITLNPILCAIEGENRRTQSYSEFCNSFDYACDLVRTHLPLSNVINYNEVHYRAGYQSIIDREQRTQKEIQFLVKISDLIYHRVPEKRLREVEDELVSESEKIGISRMSIVFILALSCLYERKDGVEPLIGRKVLKPKPGYSKSDAYNAISDISFLEMLALSNGLGIENFSFCTRDKHLAALWCSLKLTAAVWQDGNATFNVTLQESLFPRLNTVQIQDLKGRIM